MSKNRKEHIDKIEEAITHYLEQERDGKLFKGQITVKINCINGNIANTSIFISRGNEKKI